MCGAAGFVSQLCLLIVFLVGILLHLSSDLSLVLFRISVLIFRISRKIRQDTIMGYDSDTDRYWKSADKYDLYRKFLVCVFLSYPYEHALIAACSGDLVFITKFVKGGFMKFGEKFFKFICILKTACISNRGFTAMRRT